MGFFSKTIVCPNCGAPGALKTLFKTKCSSLGCTNYDAAFSGLSNNAQSVAGLAQGRTKSSLSKLEVNLSDDQAAIRIDYNNFRNEQKTFEADARTVCGRGEFISICVAPKQRRISLRKTRISQVTGSDHRVVGVVQTLLRETGVQSLREMVKRFELIG